MPMRSATTFCALAIALAIGLAAQPASAQRRGGGGGRVRMHREWRSGRMRVHLARGGRIGIKPRVRGVRLVSSAGTSAGTAGTSEQRARESERYASTEFISAACESEWRSEWSSCERAPGSELASRLGTEATRYVAAGAGALHAEQPALPEFAAGAAERRFGRTCRSGITCRPRNATRPAQL